MRIRIRTLFIIMAMAAVFSAWLATRRTARFPGVLIQLLPVNSGTATGSTGSAFEQDFYRQLAAELNRKHPDITDSMDDPEKELQESIRVDTVAKDDHTQLVTIHAWGNPLTDDDEALKLILESSIESLHSLKNDPVNPRYIKILNLPKL